MSEHTEGQSDTAERGFRRTRGQRIKRGQKRDLKRLFLHSYAHTGNFSKTCRELPVARNTIYVWLHRDRAFKAHYQAIVSRLYPPWVPPAMIDFDVGQMSDRALMAAMTRLERRRYR